MHDAFLSSLYISYGLTIEILKSMIMIVSVQLELILHPSFKKEFNVYIYDNQQSNLLDIPTYNLEYKLFLIYDRYYSNLENLYLIVHSLKLTQYLFLSYLSEIYIE